MPETIAITGASGALGRLVAELVLDDPARAANLVLTTRSPQLLADLAERGADVRAADFDDPSTLPAAFAGVDRMLLISASNATGDRIAQHGAAIDAAAAAQVGHVIFTSMPRVDDPDHPLGFPAHEYLGTEQLLAASVLPWTILRNGPYAELNLVERISDSVVGATLVTNTDGGRMALISRNDCAAAALTVLTTDGHQGKIYDITGPEAVSYEEIAAQISEVLGRPIAHVAIDDAAMVKRLRAAGEGELLSTLRTALGVAIREGYYAGLSPTLEQLTGTRGRSTTDVLRAHRAALETIF
jgi:NAD(P)H dehydrogenase (quinone)